MKVFKESMELALKIAIEHRVKEEKELGYDRDSALVAGWRQALLAVQRGEDLRIVKDWSVY